MQLLPPELTPYNSARYYQDLAYRADVDNERVGERHQRLLLLFHPEYLDPNEQ